MLLILCYKICLQQIIILLSKSATHVLDEVSNVCCYLINYLKIINISRRPLPMLAVASFVNLKILYISPHNINDDLVECFGKRCNYIFHTEKYWYFGLVTNRDHLCIKMFFVSGDMHKLRNVHIVTNAYTDCAATPVDYR